MPDEPTRLDKLLPPTVRAWVYAVLVAGNGGLVVAEAAYELPAWVFIIVGVVNAAGFNLARSNTTN